MTILENSGDYRACWIAGFSRASSMPISAMASAHLSHRGKDMKEAPIPANDAERLAALYSLNILDTSPEERFDRVTRLATKLFNVPIAYISLVDANRQWFKSACGIERQETTRKISLCSHAIAQDEPLIIPDTLLDDRFYDNPLVTQDPKIRFYAGCPLQTASGHKVATLCIADRAPRSLCDDQLTTLKSMAAIAQDQFNLIDSVELQSQLVGAKKELEETNDFIRKALGTFATEEVAKSIETCNGAIKLGGEKRTATVLMSDIRGFTPFSEKFPPETVVEVLNRYLNVMVEEILKHGGIIDSFIGDGILVVFDSARHADHAHRAVQTAIDMQKAMEGVNRWNIEKGVGPIEMGIGINTGDVVIGNVGSQKRMKYSVIGQDVNLVARIESLTIGGQILVSDSTLGLLGDAAKIAGHLRVKVKGLSAPIQVHEIASLTEVSLSASPRQAVCH
jgi:adenylate cyclase